MKTLFASKEHYLAFKKHWAQIVNDPENGPTRDPVYGNKYPGKINGFHHFLYALLRGKQPNLTSNKPYSKYIPGLVFPQDNQTAEECFTRGLERLIKLYDSPHESNNTQHHLEIFGGYVNIEMLQGAYEWYTEELKEAA